VQDKISNSPELEISLKPYQKNTYTPGGSSAFHTEKIESIEVGNSRNKTDESSEDQDTQKIERDMGGVDGDFFGSMM
jgi:hypothetical protein